MQFGVGILGKHWNLDEHRAGVRADQRGPHPQFHRHASGYAAKVAAETIHAEPSCPADLSDQALVDRLAACARPVRASEAGMVRAAFLAQYGDQGVMGVSPR